MDGWIETQVTESLRRGKCPVCDALESGEESYLTWVRTNLNDATFRQSVSCLGGYCPSHLQKVMDSLGANPYNRLNLVRVMRLALVMPPGGQSATDCHLCKSLRDTTNAFSVVINSSNQAQGSKGRPLALCRVHKPLLYSQPGEPDARGITIRGAARRRPAQSSRAITDFLYATEAVLEDFHLKDPEVLKREVERCEALMIRAVLSAVNGQSRRI